MTAAGYIDIEVVEVRVASMKALLCELKNGKDKWIPRRLAIGGGKIELGFSGTVQVAKWFADKEKLLEGLSDDIPF